MKIDEEAKFQDDIFLPLKWKEEKDFSNARHSKNKIRITIVFKFFLFAISFLFCFGLWALAGFKANFITVLIVSIFMPLIIIPLLTLPLGAPQKISLMNRVLVIDRERIDYHELMSVRLGYVNYERIEYPVASFILKTGNEKLVGLPDASYFEKLKISLGAKGIRVES